MSTKTITITEDAYNRLAGLKKSNESFSEIISRITKKVRLKDYFGILSDSGKELEKVIKEGRKKHRKVIKI